MNARKFWYWKNSKFGPKDCVLVHQDGSYREVDLHLSLSDEDRVSLTRAVGCGFKKPADGEWSVEFDVSGKTYSSTKSCINVSEVVFTVLAEIKKAQDDEALLKANPEVELERRLNSHDWTHAYSDDYRSWSAGQSNLDRIRELGSKVSPEKFRILWEKYAPTEYSILSV